MIKTALIVPKGSKYGKNKYLKDFLERNDVVSKFYGAWETPNLSLLTIAGLFPPDYSLHFIDEDHGEEIPFHQHFDLVILTGMTQQINRAYEICSQFKAKGSHTVIGGIHATIYPDEAMGYANTVMVGEGEAIFLEFLEDFRVGQPKKIYKASYYIDLSQSPIPRYDLINTALYSSYSIQTTRGCPRTCGYCTLPVMYGSKYRSKSIKQVIAEIRAIKAIDPSPFIFFADDNMFIDMENSIKLLEAIKKEDIIWGTQTDISVADNTKVLNLLKGAGCRWLFIGFENITKNSLELLDKNKWKANIANRYAKMIEKIHHAGIYIWGSFMFGTDNDSMGVFENTLDFTMKNGIYSGSFTILTPLPGTELFMKMDKENKIIDYDWSRYTFWDVVYKPLLMTEDELAKGVAWIYDQFYSQKNTKIRMSRIKKTMKNMSNTL
ncbi:radical SAM protein [Vallitalea pronyensis]|uniref:Radical SAM protein n=1 Tax=Vallitalea pronyensis TaxID=1348613 RepID=A0A8J8MIH4_9FIRM|nr:radical SAM protein [Vallitalea pronyensis]QUI21863.1 radical SAM protein [Vallitalea pronyensis]